MRTNQAIVDEAIMAKSSEKEQAPFMFPNGDLEMIEEELVSLHSQLDAFFKRHQLLVQQLSGVNALPPLSDHAIEVFETLMPDTKLDRIYAYAYACNELLGHTRNVMFELEQRLYPKNVELDNINGPRNYIMELDVAYNPSAKQPVPANQRELKRRG